jgi:hypothetical protein
MAQHSVQIGIGIKFAGQNQDGFPGQNQVFCSLELLLFGVWTLDSTSKKKVLAARVI